MSARFLAALALGVMLAASFAMDLRPGASYSEQHREHTDAPPSRRFPLGTDHLGRDRLVRLLSATRISLLLAGAASLGAMLLAVAAGGMSGYLGGWPDRLLVRIIDLMLSLPWLFLLLVVRAALPLNASPIASLAVTYALLALLGWASPARVVRASVRSLRDSEFVLQARAMGCPGSRVFLRQILPNLRPILLAQFWTSIPVFILGEANLGFLGLSAGEPFPTWGNLLRELQSPLALRPESFAAVALVAISVACFKFVSPLGGSQV